jgi:hypothetical protein
LLVAIVTCSRSTDACRILLASYGPTGRIVLHTPCLPAVLASSTRITPDRGTYNLPVLAFPTQGRRTNYHCARIARADCRRQGGGSPHPDTTIVTFSTMCLRGPETAPAAFGPLPALMGRMAIEMAFACKMALFASYARMAACARVAHMCAHVRRRQRNVATLLMRTRRA